jgi:GrpE
VNELSGEPTLGDVTARLDELTREVRRQGRAAVAAQAAAESCLTLVSSRGAGAGIDPADEGASDVDWLRALLPVADALDRILASASSLAERRSRRLVRCWPFSRGRGGDPEVRTLVEGLRVVRGQLAAALEDRGASIDRRVGIRLDPDVHRVVEVRPPAWGEAESTIVEVLRPGYAIAGRLVREAEVVASARRSVSAGGEGD